MTAVTTTPPLRFGMIGAGWMANAIVPDFAACESVDLVSLATRDLATAHEFAASRGIAKVETVESMLHNPTVDVVYIATPHHNHFELASAAIEAGKHVLVEKAFTTTAAEARQLVKTARARGVFLMEAMWMRFNPSVLRVLDLLRSGTIGQPRTLMASFGFPVPDTGGRLWDANRAGGSLLDQAVYPLTLAQLVFGEPTSIAATGSTLGYGNVSTNVDTELAAVLGYAGGEQAMLATSIRSMLPLSAHIGGSEGMIELSEAFWSDTSFVIRRPDGTRDAVTTPREGAGYVPMLRAVAHAVHAGETEHSLAPLDASIALMASVDAIRTHVKGSHSQH